MVMGLSLILWLWKSYCFWRMWDGGLPVRRVRQLLHTLDVGVAPLGACCGCCRGEQVLGGGRVRGLGSGRRSLVSNFCGRMSEK